MSIEQKDRKAISNQIFNCENVFEDSAITILVRFFSKICKYWAYKMVNTKWYMLNGHIELYVLNGTY